jgi:hypothetical protein
LSSSSSLFSTTTTTTTGIRKEIIYNKTAAGGLWTGPFFILFFCVCLLSESSTPRVQHTHKKTDDRIFLFFSFFLLERGKKVTDCRRRTSCVVLGSIWTSPPPFSFSVYCLHVFWCCEALLRLLLLSRAKALEWTFNPPTPSYSSVSNIWTRGIQTRKFHIPEKERRIVNEVGRISPSLVAVTSSFLHHIRSKKREEKEKKKGKVV